MFAISSIAMLHIEAIIIELSFFSVFRRLFYKERTKDCGFRSIRSIAKYEIR